VRAEGAEGERETGGGLTEGGWGLNLTE
jgi:hypothetical protein